MFAGYDAAMRRALMLIVCIGTAHAGSWSVTGEAGTEYDDNVQRVETGPGLDTSPVEAGVFRFGARLDHKSKPLGGNLAFDFSDLTRLVANQDVSVENVTTLAGNLRWLHSLAERPALGFGVMAIDALPLTDPVGARTFRLLGPDALLALRGENDRSLTLAFGIRDFRYKPDHDFDWWGPVANARLELVLWQPPAKTKSLELVGTLGFEQRTFYTGLARANACEPGAAPNPNCYASTDLERRDRYERAGIELTWVGHQLASLGYQLTVIDSNSYGESLARHRVTLSGTTALPLGLYGTLLAILQIDRFLDGLPVRRDLQSQEFANVEDENRSSLQLRLARHITSQWSIEGRAAIWRNLAGGAMELSYRRELVYIGIVYAR